MPKQFLKGITREGLAGDCFMICGSIHRGAQREDFILNQAAYQDPAMLIVGPNFGCGSSREHAVWGLKQFGVRCLLGTSFASIFQDNCFRNGLLAIVLPAGEVQRLQAICSDPSRNRLRVDLLNQRITSGEGAAMPFDCDALRRDDLLNGRDAIARLCNLQPISVASNTPTGRLTPGSSRPARELGAGDRGGARRCWRTPYRTRHPMPDGRRLAVQTPGLRA